MTCYLLMRLFYTIFRKTSSKDVVKFTFSHKLLENDEQIKTANM